MLKILTIFLGMLIIVSRGLAVLSPTQFKNLITKLADNKSATRGLGVFTHVLGVLIIGSLDWDFSGARAVMVFFGFACFLGGLFLLLLPAQYARIINWFVKLPDALVQFMAGIGVVLGILIVLLGIGYY